MSEHKLVETIRHALAPKYEFPYYALVRIHTKHYGTIHIPAPFFNGSECNSRSIWAGHLPIASDRRNGKYYECPFCGQTSYYSGICLDCQNDYDVWLDHSDCWDCEYDEIPERFREQELENRERRRKYFNHEALKKSVKDELLYRIDHRIPDLGIISAEIVLANNPSNVSGENESPFFKSNNWCAQYALDTVELVFDELDKMEMLREYIYGAEVIQVEGSDELRRQVNGVWQHKHEGYDYWHPMCRVHKEMRV